MENFEYSILLNDRDWAEFYLASEECSLSQPALATADEQLLSDLEEGEAAESGSVQVKVGPVLPASHSASCLPRGTPDGHLLVDEVLSGSDDETDLGSVIRFLCNSKQLGTACPQTSRRTQEGQLPRVTLKPSGSRTGLQVTVTEAAFTAKETERGDQPINPDCSLPVVLATATQGRALTEKSPGQERMERPPCAEPTNLKTTDGADNNGSSPICLELQHSKDPSLPACVGMQLPASMTSTAACWEPEPPLAAYPSSAPFYSPVSAELGGAERPEKGGKPLQVTLKAQAAAPLQENPSPSQGCLVPIVMVSAPSDMLSASRGGNIPGRVSKEEDISANVIVESGASNREALKEGGPVNQVRGSPCDNGVQPFPRAPGEKSGPSPIQATNSICDGLLQEDRETATSTGRVEKNDSGETCHYLGVALPFEEELHTIVQGEQTSDRLGEPTPYGPTLEGSPESGLSAMRWPKMYDCFFCDDTQEEGLGIGKEQPISGIDQELPEMDGPEMYEHFFSEMGEAKVRNKDGVLETVFSSGHQSAPSGGLGDPDLDMADSAMQMSTPEVYEHFFANKAKKKRNWRVFFFSIPASEVRKAARALKSFLCRPAHLLRSRPTSQGALLRKGSQGRLVLVSPRLLGENLPRPEDLGMAVMQPERPLQPVFTQRDMCLGFMAFASWAVKSSDLQAPDAWKIVLLANFGTLSAIRFFRRQVITDAQHGT
ncbi:PGC-1 and ERR-induced regulator in muscle protein 1 [Zootoca vivipara]|uniref:PGC-1 and ERR-induced regulator in muscle protein 1 n=1 Tax=Zootoca vivipara TaxID=8524 RepID=UPI0015916FF6|nr:PGC-1 and ERR-induced regulator in muscle protein 1 [Zootoca vivipara]